MMGDNNTKNSGNNSSKRDFKNKKKTLSVSIDNINKVSQNLKSFSGSVNEFSPTSACKMIKHSIEKAKTYALTEAKISNNTKSKFLTPKVSQDSLENYCYFGQGKSSNIKSFSSTKQVRGWSEKKL